ncbi:MAG: hypothetical protein CMK59_01930 [Proteobacteria bacterium]|nr:hypothetical protein [Pseudomonadota bacterium]
MRIAHVCTAHGFGHTTRQMALARELTKRGHQICLFSAAKRLLEKELFELEWTFLVSDVGLVQSDSLTIDLKATQLKLESMCSEEYRTKMGQHFKGFDLIIVDASPIAMQAAHEQDIPVIAVSNFDWAWIYEHYPPLLSWAEIFRNWQLKHDSLCLPPGPGLFYFKSVQNVDMVCRSAKPHPLKPKSILVSFGGFGLQQIENLLPQIEGVTWIFAPPNPAPQRADFLYVQDVPYRDLIAGSDIVFSKAGYGICTETARSGCHVMLLERCNFPEAKSLEDFVRQRGGIILPDLRDNRKRLRQHIHQAVLDLFKQPKPLALGSNGTANTADTIEDWLNKIL